MTKFKKFKMQSIKYEQISNESHKSAYIIQKTVQFWMTGRIIGHFEQWYEEIVDNLLEACN